MANWKQYTYVNGEPKDTTYILSADEMVSRLAQILFLRQAGEDIELEKAVKDADYEALVYKATRKLRDRTVVHLYLKQ